MNGYDLPTGGVLAAQPPDTAALDALFKALDLKAAPQQAAALLRYLDLLKHWNSTYNLTSVRDTAAMFTQHLADCLAVVPALRRHLVGAGTSQRVLDVGSGGGLPGVVLAVLEPELQVLCVDAVGKKVAFIRQVAGNLRLGNLDAAHSRVENLRTEPFQLVTSRAFSSLADLVRLTRMHLLPQGAWMAMKGRLPEDEIAALPADVEVFHVEPLVVPGLEAQRCLIWMRLKASV